jgi:hypothetical protein
MSASATIDMTPEAVPAPRFLGVRAITLGLVWIAVASGAVVFTEPAPVDALTMGLILALPIVGLVAFRPLLLGLLAVMLVMAASALIAATQSLDLRASTVHSFVSLYLYAAAFIFAAFVAQRPGAHARFIMHAYLWAAFIAAVAGVAGYLDAFPGAAELFTKHERASGTFKDPNVFGAFLVPALIYALHMVVTRPFVRTMLPGVMLLFLTFAVILSFSRGAWFNFAIAALAYGYIAFATSGTNRHRIKLVFLAALGTGAIAILLAAITQVPEIAERLADRASLTQSYDEGPEGRFGGQAKARSLILDSPLGIGALQFGGQHHFEDAHNVYLSMFLNAGWLGGLFYSALVLVTLIIGFSHLLRRTETQPIFVVAYTAFLGVAIEGLVIDTDHWRHFYLLLAILWGLMASDRRALTAAAQPQRSARIMPEVTLLGPQRANRILGPARRRLPRIEPGPRRLREERPRRPERNTYR